ncbi:MAG: hypothetical protein O9338_18260, partial [Microcystis sp. LE19-251.1A]|nr:hypothetical protein [Microcystis sp. LE19-251.1A]
GVDPTGLACYCGTPRDDKLAEAGRQVGVGVAQSETKVDDAILIGAFAAMAAPVAIEVGAAALANPVGATRTVAAIAEGVVPGSGANTLAATGAAGIGTAAKLATSTDDAIIASERATNFVVSPKGTAYPVPKGAQGPAAVVNQGGKQTGVAYTGGAGGANGKVDRIRIMNPTPARGASPGYPNGYIKYENANGQGVNPITGRTVPNAESHYPIE